MENKRLYNIILQNYPDFVARRKSEVNLNVDCPPEDAKPEPAQLQVEIRAKKSKIESESKGDNKNVANGNNKSQEIHTKPNEDKETKKSHGHVSKAPPQQQNWLRQLSTDHHYLKDMPLYSKTLMRRGAMLSIPRYKLRASSLPDMYRNSMSSIYSESDDEMVSKSENENKTY